MDVPEDDMNNSESRSSFTTIESSECSDFGMSDETFYQSLCDDIFDMGAAAATTTKARRKRTHSVSGSYRKNDIKKTVRKKTMRDSSHRLKGTPNSIREKLPSMIEFIPSPTKLRCTNMSIKEVIIRHSSYSCERIHSAGW